MNKLKQFLPFVFPMAAIVLVAILAVRWYRLRDEQIGQVSEFAEGVEIEDLTPTELDSVMRGANDVEQVELETEDETAMGRVRYELIGGKVKFSVAATLPELDEGHYQVWLQDVDGQSSRQAFVLELGKGGYIGSGAISDEALPFAVVVSREKMADDQLEEVLLKGVVTVPELVE